VPAWQVRIGTAVEAPIVLAGDAVIFGDRGGNVWSLDIKEGKQLWRRELGPFSAVTGGVAVSEGTVFVPSLDKMLYALKQASGEDRWKPVATGGLIRATPTVARVPLLNNRRFVFFGSDDGRVYSVDAEQGTIRWKSEKIGSAHGAVLVVGNQLYAGTDDDHLHVLETTGGTEVWKLKVGAAVRTSPVLSADGKQVYLGADDGVLYAVDLEGRRVVWRRPCGGGALRSGPVLLGGQLLYGNAGGTVGAVRVRERSADPIWEHRLGNQVTAAPLVTKSRVYVGSHDGRFFSLDRGNDGSPVWSYKTGGRVRSTANWVKGLVLFGSDDGFVYAFDERP
jgi:outer membrane protein assembly factor BamB